MSAKINWHAFASKLLPPEAQALIAGSTSLSTTVAEGPLTHLLSSIRGLLVLKAGPSAEIRLTSSDAKAAVQTQSVFLLAKVLHVLQAEPCLEWHTQPQMLQPGSSSDWLRVMRLLGALLDAVWDTRDEEVVHSFWTQLFEAEGNHCTTQDVP